VNTPPRAAVFIAASVILITTAWLTAGWLANRVRHRPGPIQSLRVDLNTAGESELRLLPEIGPALAARIVADREAHGPFVSVEALARVRGVGPRTVAEIAPFARVTKRPPGPTPAP